MIFVGKRKLCKKREMFTVHHQLSDHSLFVIFVCLCGILRHSLKIILSSLNAKFVNSWIPSAFRNSFCWQVIVLSISAMFNCVCASFVRVRGTKIERVFCCLIILIIAIYGTLQLLFVFSKFL